MIGIGCEPRIQNLIPSQTCIPVVVISGTSSGIGKKTSLMLAKKGYVIFSGIRKEKDGQKLVHLSSNYTGTIIPINLDVTSEVDIENCFNEVQTYLTTHHNAVLAGVICNAGVALISNLEACDMKSIKGYFDINYFGAIQLAQTFIPLLEESKGRIIFIGSFASYLYTKGLGIYSSTKAALRASAFIMRAELMNSGIDVVLLEPGIFNTELLDKTRKAYEIYLSNPVSSAGIDSTGSLIANKPKFKDQRCPPHPITQKVTKLFSLPCDHVVSHILHSLQAPWTNPSYDIGIDARLARVIDTFIPKWLVEKVFDV